jgi:hypothetical protein
MFKAVSLPDMEEETLSWILLIFLTLDPNDFWG